MASINRNPVRSTTMLAKRQAWILKVSGLLAHAGRSDLASKLPDPNLGLYPESADALELTLTSILGNAGRIDYRHWDWYARPGDAMRRNLNKARAVKMYNEIIGMVGLSPVPPKPLTAAQRRTEQSKQGQALSLFGGE